jgi:hypothetical protein
MRTVAAVAFGMMLFIGTAQAKPKTRTLSQPCSVVFPIAEQIGSAKPYKMQLDGKTDMNLIVETGSFWKAGASQIIVSFTPNENGTCTVTDNSSYSGARRNGTVFLDRLEKAITESNPTR